jgi:hypothetical protein
MQSRACGQPRWWRRWSGSPQRPWPGRTGRGSPTGGKACLLNQCARWSWESLEPPPAGVGSRDRSCDW